MAGLKAKAPLGLAGEYMGKYMFLTNFTHPAMNDRAHGSSPVGASRPRAVYRPFALSPLDLSTGVLVRYEFLNLFQMFLPIL